MEHPTINSLYTSDIFIKFCINQHDVVCNQKYDKILPYSKHLDYVYNQCQLFDDLRIENELSYFNIKCAIYGHDLIEDARVSYNDIKEMVGRDVAEIIYLCTENKGRDRSERKNDRFYEELNYNKSAIFVKLCDLIANIKYSLLTNSSMFKKYKDEWNDKIYKHLNNTIHINKYRDDFNVLNLFPFFWI